MLILLPCASPAEVISRDGSGNPQEGGRVRPARPRDSEKIGLALASTTTRSAWRRPKPSTRGAGARSTEHRRLHFLGVIAISRAGARQAEELISRALLRDSSKRFRPYSNLGNALRHKASSRRPSTATSGRWRWRRTTWTRW